MFAKLLEAMFGIGSGTSWLDLDERMKGQLRFWGIIAVLVLVLLILSSLYFYVEWTPLKELVDAVLGDVRKSIKDKDAMPPWVLWAGGTWFAVLVVASLIFFYFLFSFGKMHYKIDRVTFRAIPEVGSTSSPPFSSTLNAQTIPAVACASCGRQHPVVASS
jgi:hypothetical protein